MPGARFAPFALTPSAYRWQRRDLNHVFLLGFARWQSFATVGLGAGMKRDKQRVTSIEPANLAEGYNLAVENGLRLFASALDLNETFPDKALALAQVGQEEIGKSLTILAAFALRKDSPAWEGFWYGWHSHNLKAHRAFLYELLNPLRIELTFADGTRYPPSVG